MKKWYVVKVLEDGFEVRLNSHNFSSEEFAQAYVNLINATSEERYEVREV